MKILKLLNNNFFSILSIICIFFFQNLLAEEEVVDIWNLEIPEKNENVLLDGDIENTISECHNSINLEFVLADLTNGILSGSSAKVYSFCLDWFKLVEK